MRIFFVAFEDSYYMFFEIINSWLNKHIKGKVFPSSK